MFSRGVNGGNFIGRGKYNREFFPQLEVHLGPDTLTTTKIGIVQMLELEITPLNANLNRDSTNYVDRGQDLPQI